MMDSTLPLFEVSKHKGHVEFADSKAAYPCLASTSWEGQANAMHLY